MTQYSDIPSFQPSTIPDFHLDFDMGALGKLLILIGVLIVVIGLLLILGEKIPWIGRLPGDLIIKREKFSFYFPITTCIIISIILTLLFALFRK